MEQLIYETPVSDSFFSLEQSAPALSQFEANDLMQQFMSSIDLHRLASVFFQQLQTKLAISAVKLQFSSGSLTLGDAEKSCNIKTLDFSHQQRVFATAHYSFDRKLDVEEKSLLSALHDYFRQPLNNALEFHKLKQIAMKDYLTSLGNRASYQETIHRQVSQAKRQFADFGLLVLDLDKFKQVNDTHGHQEGDRVLIEMAEILKTCLRDTDYAFRFGGDEFCCLMPGADQSINNMIAHRILTATRQNTVLARHGVTCSIGMANFKDGDTENSLFSRADKALYDAKNAGRCCIKAA